MSITLIRSRRRLVQANSYNSPHHRKNKKLLATTQGAKMPYRFKYYQFQDYKFKDELEELEEIN